MTNKTQSTQNQKEKIILKMWHVNGEKIPVLFLPESKAKKYNIIGFDYETYCQFSEHEFSQDVYTKQCKNPASEDQIDQINNLLNKFLNYAKWNNPRYPGYTIVKRDSNKMRLARWKR